VSIFIFDNGCDQTVTEAAWHIGIWLVGLEGIPIIAVESVFSAEPEKAAAILENRPHRTLGEALFDAEMIETQNTFTNLGEESRRHPTRRRRKAGRRGNRFGSRRRRDPPTAGGDQAGKQESVK